MKQLLFLSLLAFNLMSCTKDNLDPTTQPAETLTPAGSGKPGPPIGGGGPCAPNPTPTYLIPAGGGTYTATYSGIPVTISGITYTTEGTPFAFYDYGTYYGTLAYGNGGNNSFTYSQTCCNKPFNGSTCTSLCCEWKVVNVSATLLYVLNPPAGAPSPFVLVPPSSLFL